MRIQLFSSLSFILFFLILLIVSVSSQCLNHEQTILIQLKNTIKFDDSWFSTKIVTWNQSTDCCSWEGVNCNTDGHVIGLDLSSEGISGGIENSSPLFSLPFLRSLNLAYNNFNFIPIPPRIGNLTNLTYLNLSNAGFSRRIPGELSNMISLVTLDLSAAVLYSPENWLILENQNLAMLLRNLKELTELYLDNVKISAQGYDWCQAISSSLPKLKALSLSNCLLSGPIDDSLAKLQSLSIIRLSFNNLSSPVPEFFANFTNLRVLDLSSCELYGQFPGRILQIPTLETLDLSDNDLLNGFLPIFPQNASLQTLVLRFTNFSQALPDSIGNLRMLFWLDLYFCKFSGQIPHSMARLTQLHHLDLSCNKFSGPIPSFQKSKNLTYLDLYGNFLSGPIPKNCFEGLVNLEYINLGDNAFNESIPPSLLALSSLQEISLLNNNFHGPIPFFQKSKYLNHLDLSHNGFSGPIPNTCFEGLVNLAYVSLESNAFNGSIPSSLFALSSLQVLLLSNNNFHGLLPNFSNASSSPLAYLHLNSNRLEGTIPKSFFDLKILSDLSLSNNHLNGTVELEAFSGFGLLTILDLSNNNLSIETRGENSTLSTVLPHLSTLNLASCKLKYFPNLKNHSSLTSLDLSKNRIGGEIPSWIWKLGNEFGYLRNLNLSYNALENLQEPYVIPPSLHYLDLHSNRLHGEIPILPDYAEYLDYSANQFNTSLPADIGYRLNLTNFFSVSSNRITGSIPDSICTARNLYVLDLSNNHLSGTIPSCFVQLTRSLGVLNLGENNFSGNIPGIFLSDCRLETLDLHGNHLEGKVPLSLGSCSMLKVLNLGNNLINDTFPCFLKNCSNLRVLTLRYNKLHGDIQCTHATKVWSKLQIIDLASNYFIGHVPNSSFLNWRAMISDDDGEQSKLNYLHVGSNYYVDKVTVVIKGYEIELVKILIIFTSIDFSNNWFSGEIPGSIGELKALHLLNMSHNAFKGSIPASIGNLKQLESLDLSVNNLTGRIPTELDKLTFLSFLNLSYNLLEGRIPTGPQLQTFTETSFQGNKGLCGSQLNISCTDEQGEGSSPLPSEEASETIVDLISFEVGFVVGLVTVIAPLVLSRRWSKWYFKHVDRIVAAKVYRYYQRRNQERKSPIRRL